MSTEQTPPDAPTETTREERIAAALDAHGAAIRDLAAAIARGLHEVALAIRQR